MTRFLFWNINKKPRQHLIANLALRRSVDVVMLAECELEPSVVLSALNRDHTALYHYAKAKKCKNKD